MISLRCPENLMNFRWGIKELFIDSFGWVLQKFEPSHNGGGDFLDFGIYPTPLTAVKIYILVLHRRENLISTESWCAWDVLKFWWIFDEGSRSYSSIHLLKFCQNSKKQIIGAALTQVLAIGAHDFRSKKILTTVSWYDSTVFEVSRLCNTGM